MPIKLNVKTKGERQVDIIVNPNSDQLLKHVHFNCIHFPENLCMPLTAVKKVKKELDRNKKDVVLFTCNSDVTRFAYHYHKIKHYKVRLFYGTKRMSLPKVFKKFNKVFDFHENAIPYSHSHSVNK